MNAFDAFVLLAALALFCVGMLRGVVRISVGLGGMILGLVVALQYEATLAARVQHVVSDDVLAHLLSFALLVMAVMALSLFVGWILRHLLKKAHLGWLDRLLGAAAESPGKGALPLETRGVVPHEAAGGASGSAGPGARQGLAAGR